MAFFIRQNENWFLSDTSVENIFINEYMVQAPDNYVKIYILALMFTQMGRDITNEAIAKELSIEEEDVLKCWNYWESKSVISKHYKDDKDKFKYDVEFLSLKVSLSQEEKRPAAKVSPLEDAEIKGLYMAIEQILARPLSGTEMKAIEDWLLEMGTDPEVILCAYSYSKKLNKDNYRYVGAVVKSWTEKGFKTAEDVATYLAETDEKHYTYRRIFKALGFDRNWTEKEQAIMDKWIGEMGFSIDRILEACAKSSGITNPNINYVNKVLSNWYEEAKEGKSEAEEKTPEQGRGKKISKSQVLKYYEYIRENAEKTAEKRRREVYKIAPRIRDIEKQLREKNVEMSKAMVGLGSGKDKRVKEIREKIDALTVERAFLLTDNEFPPDYMDVKYKCNLCRDTGINDGGERCECFSQRMEEAIKWQNQQK